MNLSERRVAIWRESLLPVSETFILNQSEALKRWTGTLVGAVSLPNGIAPNSSVAAFDATRFRKLHSTAFAMTGQSSRVRTAMRATDARLVHAHFGTDAALIVPTVRRLRLPLVVTFHGQDATRNDRRTDVKRSILRRRYATIFEYASALIGVSDFICEQLLEMGAAEAKVLRSYIGIPMPPDSQPTSDRKGVLFVGRLVPKKGIEDLIVALSAADPGHEEELTVIGDGPLLERARQIAHANGVPAQFLGAQGVDSVRGAMRTAALLCVPSRTAPDGDAEGMGMVFLEAAAQRLPVVSYHHGGVPEAVAHNESGLLAAEGNVSELSSHLARLLGDPNLRSALGATARKRVERLFDIENCIDELEDVYDAVVNTHAPR